MSVVIYGTDGSYPQWGYQDGIGGSVGGSTYENYYPYPLPGSVQSSYINKCVDGVTGQWVFWQTFYQDYQGSEYPGQSFDSGTYRVQAIKFDREQG